MRITTKFGGSSLASAERIRAAADIVRSDPDRCVVVVSAAGKRYDSDEKFTDLLLSLKHSRKNRERRRAVLRFLEERCMEMCSKLKAPLSTRTLICASFREVERLLEEEGVSDYVVSRGEYWSAHLMAVALGPEWQVVDAADLIRFDVEGVYDKGATAVAFKQASLPDHFVMPGYYGADGSGIVRVFPRNGSDISGAIAARYAACDVYENWTDTEGVYACDPRVVTGARQLPELTVHELGELAYGGASVLHHDALFPLQGTNIEVRVRSTLRPDGAYTRVVARKELLAAAHRGPVIGVASRNGFSILKVDKTDMQQDVGFLKELCGIFAGAGINIEQVPGGLTSQTVVVENADLERKLPNVVREINKAWPSATVKVDKDFALVCVVGETMEHQHGIAARIFGCLARSAINVRTIEQSASEISIIIGVSSADHRKAAEALAREFGLVR